MKKIVEIAQKINIGPELLEQHGDYIAKVDFSKILFGGENRQSPLLRDFAEAVDGENNQVSLPNETSAVRDKISPGKLILVTAMTPTRYGEGKTTMSIGLADALTVLNKNI